MNRRRGLSIVAIAILLGVLAPVLRGEDAEAVPRPLDRIAVIGASATAGFGVVLRYKGEEFDRMIPVGAPEVLAAVITEPEVTMTGEGSGLFFMSPSRRGHHQATTAAATDPTLVMGLDFLFWYGYGNRDEKGQAIPPGPLGHDTRLALLEKGLQELDRFNCPVVVGDYPDVSNAVGYMLSSDQVPAPATLAALNTRLKEWAASRPNVILVPMSRLIASMRSDEAFTAGRQQWPQGVKAQFMQMDNLHPTLDGLIILIQEAADHVARHASEVNDTSFDFSLESVRKRLYETHRPAGTTARPHVEQP